MEIRLKIEDDMSKFEEVEILNKLKDAFEKKPNNYLASLFTNQLVTWAGGRMKNDFPVDPMEYVFDTKREDEMADLRKQVADQKSTMDTYHDLLEKNSEEIRRLKLIETNLKDDLQDQNERWNRDIEEWQEKIKEAIKAKDELFQRNLELKAKLYDLTVK